jgi:hypothetical protein
MVVIFEAPNCIWLSLSVPDEGIIMRSEMRFSSEDEEQSLRNAHHLRCSYIQCPVDDEPVMAGSQCDFARLLSRASAQYREMS